jgi:hypothetical protein
MSFAFIGPLLVDEVVDRLAGVVLSPVPTKTGKEESREGSGCEDFVSGRVRLHIGDQLD